VQPPETRYAKSGDLNIAHQVIGQGPIDVVLVDQWFSHMDGLWDVPPLAELVERLATFSRVITFDQRGIGLSDPVPIASLPSIEEWMDDLRAVMDAVGSERAALIAGLAAGFMATVFAATYPGRASSLVLVDTFPRFVRAPDYPWGAPAAERTRRLDEVQAEWGRGLMLHQFAPSMAGDRRLQEAWARYERQSASPGTALAMVGMLYESDIRHVLPTIQIPTLVIARGQADRIPPGHSRYLADHIPGAKYVELPGIDTLMWAGDQEATVAEIQEFITGARPVPEPDRVLATVLFTDIVRSTDLAAELGDHRWRGVLAEHDRIVRRQLDRFRGREVKTTGDGFLATFDGPARAIRCAGAIRDGVRALEIEVRAGLHTGEIEVIGGDVGGIAVHIGARVAALAGADQVLVSSTVKDLVAGSGIEFEDRGTHSLKGVPGEWRLFAVKSA
jgi:class 3 adenylate cyclase